MRLHNPHPKVSKRKDSTAEILLMKHLKELGIGFEREMFFALPRKWRFDFAIGAFEWSSRPYAIEIEGGAWTQGRHTRGKGFIEDIRKYNEAARLGWVVIRFTPSMIETGESKTFLAELFGRQAEVRSGR